MKTLLIVSHKEFPMPARTVQIPGMPGYRSVTSPGYMANQSINMTPPIRSGNPDILPPTGKMPPISPPISPTPPQLDPEAIQNAADENGNINWWLLLAPLLTTGLGAIAGGKTGAMSGMAAGAGLLQGVAA